MRAGGGEWGCREYASTRYFLFPVAFFAVS